KQWPHEPRLNQTCLAAADVSEVQQTIHRTANHGFTARKPGAPGRVSPGRVRRQPTFQKCNNGGRMTVEVETEPHVGGVLAPASPRRLVDVVFRVREFGIVAVLLLLVLVTGAIQPRFWSSQELTFVLLDTMVFALLAIGETMVVLTRNVDLSVG